MRSACAVVYYHLSHVWVYNFFLCCPTNYKIFGKTFWPQVFHFTLQYFSMLSNKLQDFRKNLMDHNKCFNLLYNIFLCCPTNYKIFGKTLWTITIFSIYSIIFFMLSNKLQNFRKNLTDHNKRFSLLYNIFLCCPTNFKIFGKTSWTKTSVLVYYKHFV